MADKNFKVKSGLQVPSLTTAGPVITDSAGNVTSSATLPITQGGTGQTTAGNALNALLPLQTSQDNKFLQTNGVSTQWTIPQQQTSTDGTLGYKVYSGTVTPSSPVTGDIWIDQTTGNGIQLVRWRKTIASTTITLTGLDDNNLTLSYTAGNEQVYINGTLITRGQDYTATNGTSVVLTQAAEVGDTVEIFGNPLFSVTDVYTQAQSNSLYVRNSNYPVAGKNKIINGNMLIDQRASTTTVNAAAGTYTLDRWRAFGQTSDGVFTVTQDSSSPSEFSKSLKVTVTTADTNITSSQSYQIGQIIEGLNTIDLAWGTSAAKSAVLSFWVKSSVTGTFGGGLRNSASSRSYPFSYTINTADTWEKKTVTIGAETTGTWLKDTGSGIRIDFSMGAGSTYLGTAGAWNTNNNTGATGQTNIIATVNATWFITGVQFEIGSVATAFQTATGNIQGELAACQRYFQRFGNSVAYEPFGVAHGIDVNNARMYLPLKVNMRTNPTFSSTAASTFQKSFGTTSGLSTIALGASSNHAVSIDFSRTSEFTANGGFIISSVGAGNAYIDLSAEL